MPKYSGPKRATLKAYVQETVTFNMATRKAIAFIQSTYQEKLSEPMYRKLRDEVREEEGISTFLSDEARIGVARSHREQVVQTEDMRAKLLAMLDAEFEKPDMVEQLDQDGSPTGIMKANKDKDKRLILATVNTINDLNKTLDDLHQGSPAVAAFRAAVTQNETRVLEGKQEAIGGE